MTFSAGHCHVPPCPGCAGRHKCLWSALCTQHCDCSAIGNLDALLKQTCLAYCRLTWLDRVVPFDYAIPFHMLVAMVGGGLAIVHACFHMIDYAHAVRGCSCGHHITHEL